MVNRWVGFATAVLMVTANLALLSRDVFSRWLAGTPPTPSAFNLEPEQERFTQVGLFDDNGNRIGYAWTHARRTLDFITVRSTTLLAPLSLATLKLPSLRFEMTMNYVESTHLDSFNFTVAGLGVGVEVRGDFVPPNDFPCRWQFGDKSGSFVLPAEATQSFGESLRPFSSLPQLEVGQSWRHEVINPLAGMTSGLGGAGQSTLSMVVRVTRAEHIEHMGRGVRALVVEAENVKAWVSPLGDVLRQEIEVPLLGRVIIEQEEYNPRLRRESNGPLFGQ